MMQSSMMFGEIIGTISLSFAPLSLKLTLAHTIVNPVKTHIDRFRPFLSDCVGCNAASSIVVGRHGSGRLWIPHFFEGNAERARFLAVVEQGAQFSFGGAREDFAHNVAQNVDCAVTRITRALGNVGLVVKKKYPAARDCPLTTDKYNASLSTARIM
jgi:hypothetical protein